MGKFIDMTGWVMKEHGVLDSRLTVISRAENQNKHIMWHCLCECGKLVDIRGDQLRSGVAKSCGCIQKEIARKNCKNVGKANRGKSNHIDLTNKDFGYLTVLEYKETINNRACWRCRCVCGKEIILPSDKLLSGHTRSCGCKSRNLASEAKVIDYTNQKIGRLKVQKYLGIKNHLAQWQCLCDCGRICVVNSSYLKTSKFPSCGCIISMGEIKIKTILEELNYHYVHQFSFPDLQDKKPLRFDFAIFKDNILLCLLEYQGEQHYRDTSRGLWLSPSVHDQMKRDYCEEKKIKLIEVPYYNYNKLNTDYIKELINEGNN